MRDEHSIPAGAIRRTGERPAFIWEDREYSYAWLLEQIVMMDEWIAAEGLHGQLVTLEEDYSPMRPQRSLRFLERDALCCPWTFIWLKPSGRNIFGWHR